VGNNMKNGVMPILIAYSLQYGAQFWWVNGKIHRTDGPAVIYSYGSQEQMVLPLLMQIVNSIGGLMEKTCQTKSMNG
jgi:hypothetical protein